MNNRQDYMKNRIQIVFLLCLLISHSGNAQSDTNHLYLDYIELNFADSTEKLISLVLQNDSNALVFTDTSEFKMISISRTQLCHLKIQTNKSIVKLENINEYISFIETKYRISVFMPINHNTCISSTYLRPDGLILLHSQTMEQMDANNNFDNCIVVDAGPTGYSSFEEFSINHTLD